MKVRALMISESRTQEANYDTKAFADLLAAMYMGDKANSSSKCCVVLESRMRVRRFVNVA